MQMPLAFNGKNIAKHFSALIQINIPTWKKFQDKIINLLIHYQKVYFIAPANCGVMDINFKLFFSAG